MISKLIVVLVILVKELIRINYKVNVIFFPLSTHTLKSYTTSFANIYKITGNFCITKVFLFLTHIDETDGF